MSPETVLFLSMPANSHNKVCGLLSLNLFCLHTEIAVKCFHIFAKTDTIIFHSSAELFTVSKL